MNIFAFIRTNKLTIIFFILTTIIANFMMILSSNLEKSGYDILYFDFLIVVFAIIFGLFSYRIWHNRYTGLRRALEEHESFNSTFSEDDSFYTVLLKDVIEQKNSESEIGKQELKNAIDELDDYITKWVHEIKIPISVCELILERDDGSVLAKELQTEIERIKFLTNQVLYISRASNYSEDLSVREVNIQNVVKSSIKRNAALLISKNIEVSISNLDFIILSDEKWISYIMDQLLHNAYKYMNRDGRIEISALQDEKENVRLKVRDNGIGIMQKDIARIFDKSFTGNSKANLSKSTGMGLYITKKMLNRLKHNIDVVSEQNNFTEFTITFYRISDYEINFN